MKSFLQLLEQSIELLATKKIEDLSQSDLSVAIGVLTIVGGWKAKARGGSQVEAFVNHKWV